MNVPRQHWGPERRATLHALLPTQSVAAVAKALGTSRGAIYKILVEDGVPPPQGSRSTRRARSERAPLPEHAPKRPWDDARIAQLRELWGANTMSVQAIADELGTSVGAIQRLNRKRKLGLPRKSERRGAILLPPSHPAMLARTTRWANTIVAPQDSPRLLIDGAQSSKLGFKVEVGRWKGMPIYGLTLVERATCPATCTAWAICYGNNMPFARRHALTPALMPLIEAELDRLDALHGRAGGYVVRLHVLGDFGSPNDEPLALAYVAFWHQQLRARPGLHIFGYTAHERGTPIGKAIFGMTSAVDRCWLRFSGTLDGRYGAVVIHPGEPAPAGVVVCPYDAGKVDSCGKCGACWKLDRPIGFPEH